MLFFVADLRPEALDPIVQAMRSRDPRALVAVAPQPDGVRVVGRLTLRHMLEAFIEAGVDAVPECRLAAVSEPAP
jgi:hypothetical protein